MSAGGSFRAPPVEDLQPHFPQYSIDAFVAVGGMGAVYRATQISVDRPVALKILPPAMATDEAFQRRFAMEAKAMAKLSHRNLVQLYDFGETNGVFWMIQEWIEGRTIFEVMEEEGRLAPKEAAALVAQACEGLGYAHKQGIVHRDVKPANMMVDSEGVLKLMDFGLARATHGEADGLRAPGEARFATEEYAAPELWEPDAVIDHRVDIFALGVLLYEALTGARPTGTFRLPSEVRPGLDTRFDDIVVRAMQADPKDRYESCGTLMAALRQVVSSPPKVRLQAASAAKPATGALKPKTAPGGPPPGPAVPQPGPAVPQPGETIPAGGGKRPTKVVATVCVLVLLGALGAGWLAMTGGRGKTGETADGTEATSENAPGNAATPHAPPEPAPAPTESARERIERLARERLARSEAADNGGNAANTDPRPEPEPAPPAPPEPGPEPEPMPRPGIAEVLSQADAELQANVAASLGAYAVARGELAEKYLAECAKEESNGVRAGDLDAVLFWQAEAAAIERGGDPVEDDAEAPTRAVALRKAWRTRMKPFQDSLAPIQSAYLDKLTELEAEAGGDAEKALLRKRREDVARIDHFAALCAGKAPPFLDDAAADAPAGSLPGDLIEADKTTRERLEQLKSANDRDAMAALIKSYGSRLVRDERALTKRREIESARAVRRVKDEMLALLREVEGAPGPEIPAATAGQRAVELIRNGSPSDECLYDNKEWKRRGKTLESEGENVSLRSRLGIGGGDFRLEGTMTMSQVGASDTLLRLGDLYLIFDDDSGAVSANQPWNEGNYRTNGVQLGSLVRAETPFKLAVERRGESLQLLLNGEQAVQCKVHTGELGAVTVTAGKGTLSIEELTLSGAPVEVPEPVILHDALLQYQPVNQVQLVKTSDDGLLCLSAVSHNGPDATVRMNRSRDGGERWDETEVVINENWDHTPVGTFSAACNMARDEVWLAYAVGAANHKLHVTMGRNGGRNWSQPLDVTEAGKEAGANVSFAGAGVVLQRHQAKRGRILLPMLAGGEERKVTLLVSESGRDWRRIGPLTGVAEGGVEMAEGPDGTLYLATGAPVGQEDRRYRLWATSEDGGETWSAPARSPLPDHGSLGSLAIVKDRKGEPRWYRLSVDGPDGGAGTPRHNASLFGSRDGGKTWRALRRFHHGTASSATLVPLDDGAVAIAYKRALWSGHSDQVRFVVLRDVWGK